MVECFIAKQLWVMEDIPKAPLPHSPALMDTNWLELHQVPVKTGHGIHLSQLVLKVRKIGY